MGKAAMRARCCDEKPVGDLLQVVPIRSLFLMFAPAPSTQAKMSAAEQRSSGAFPGLPAAAAVPVALLLTPILASRNDFARHTSQDPRFDVGG